MLFMNCWIDIEFYLKINQGLVLEIFIISHWTDPMRGFYEFVLWLSVPASIFNRNIFLKIGSLVFPDILHKVEEPQVLKTVGVEFFWEILARPTTTQNGPISPFVLYYSIFLVIGSLVFYLIFCMKLRDHKYSKLME